MTLGQLIEYIKKIFFFKICAKSMAGRLVPDLFLSFKNAQYEVKASALQLNSSIFQYISVDLNLANDKTKLYKVLDY